MSENDHLPDPEPPDDGDDADKAAAAAGQERRERLGEDVDTILDEIDDVLEENAEVFVRAYVRKGGQGWSSFLDPSFFVGAAAASVVAAASWDALKLSVNKVIAALRHTGDGSAHMLNADELLADGTEELLRKAWERARRIPTDAPPGHDTDEASALQWILFLSELHRATGFVKLRAEHYEKIAAAAAASPEMLQPSQLVARIIDEWLRRHPNAGIGLHNGHD